MSGDTSLWLENVSRFVIAVVKANQVTLNRLLQEMSIKPTYNYLSGNLVIK